MAWKRVAIVAAVVLALGGAAAAVLSGISAMAHDWRTASHEAAGIAPDPATTPEAVAQVYVARAWGWRGTFGVHSWVAVKPSGAPAFTRYEVIGWRVLHGGGPALTISNRPADARWFGSMPVLIAEVRGDGVDAIIARIGAAARSYPYANEYRVWPGPNSNTFTAHVGRAVPEFKMDLPPTAIGKDYLTNGSVFAAAPSGTGFQVSLFGILGVLAAIEEGLEINVLGLTFGIDPKDLALKLPLAGRIGPGI
ncbi:MAG: DUF3750 domain-containing protein [Rhodospirillales bacterium]